MFREVEIQKIVNGSRNIVWLSEIGKKDIAIAGGKGANLAEIYNLDLPVPPAFVITIHAFTSFISASGIRTKILSIINTIDIENTEDLENKAKEIQNLITKADIEKELAEEITEAYFNLNVDEKSIEEASDDALNIISASKEPCFVAVRSSATAEDSVDASFAGQQETFLNVKGNNELLDAVKKCWASLFTARAIYYRTRNKFSNETSYIALVVQRMINSEKSGVTFTINPSTNEKNEIMIEAVFGLGEGIVSGSIEPDSYILDKESLILKAKRIGSKRIFFSRDSRGHTVKKQLPEDVQREQVLTGYEIKSLSNYAVKIEEHYKWPQDIEWAIESGRIYILQTRPVTTTKKEIKKVELKGNIFVEGLAASSGIASGTVKIVYSSEDLKKISKDNVLVTKMTNPDMVVTMNRASAIVTDEGGITCHAAIVSREIGVPCVVGTKNATGTLKEGQVITVDGTNGKVYDGNVSEEIKSEPKIETIPEETKKAFDESRQKEKETKDGHNILVKVNCDLPEVAERAASTNADGVGLVRIEFIIAQGGIHPLQYIKEGKHEEYTKLLAENTEKIASAFKEKPVWIRTSDIRSDEYKGLKGSENEDEDNPMLGMHGIRKSLHEIEILKAEFRAVKLLHDKGYKNVGVMIPFLISVDELKKSKQIMREIGLEPCRDIEFGVMIETPAACMIIDSLCKEGISFISFGTNDLTQLVLGVDRNNENLSDLYDEMHPAVLRLLKQVIETCRQHNIKTSICGQAASRPEMVKFLARQKIDSISANIDAVSLVRETLKDISY